MSQDPFEPPASDLVHQVSVEFLVGQGVVYAASAFPGCWMLYLSVALRDLCAPLNPAMKTLSLVFHVGGPLLAGCIGAYGLTAWPAAREGWLARLLLGGIAAGATTVVLLGFADTARAWAAGGTFGEVLQAGLNGFPGAVALGVMAAAMLGWLPALGSGMLANRIQR